MFAWGEALLSKHKHNSLL